MDEEKVSPALEDYLETILFLYQRNGNVRVTDVAVEMSISKPSVNKAINILKTQGYVEHEHYGLLNLTEAGMELAKNVAVRHYALKRFLHELLEIDAETAEAEACLIEHVVSAGTIAKLTKYLDGVLGEK